MSNTKEIPIHTVKIFLDISRKPNSFTSLHNAYAISPSTLSIILRFLKKAGFIKVVIIRSEVRDGMRRAYELTEKGRKALPLFKEHAEAEDKIFEMARK